MRSTHNYVLMEVSEATYNEIDKALKLGGYDVRDETGELDMHGIAIVKKADPPSEYSDYMLIVDALNKAYQQRVEMVKSDEMTGAETAAFIANSLIAAFADVQAIMNTKIEVTQGEGNTLLMRWARGLDDDRRAKLRAIVGHGKGNTTVINTGAGTGGNSIAGCVAGPRDWPQGD